VIAADGVLRSPQAFDMCSCLASLEASFPADACHVLPAEGMAHKHSPGTDALVHAAAAADQANWSNNGVQLASLPASFTKLARLRQMNMLKVQVTGGSLPPLWRMPGLSAVSLRLGTNVTGGLPASWGKMTELLYLQLGMSAGMQGEAACFS
jgi:hypothetical protein